ncbi:hypothetical protein DL768_002584 [Monosporascus sp. mg162]|nr:hypothetical protein DL768_002584 [Monosporascus sp. mg162]
MKSTLFGPLVSILTVSAEAAISKPCCSLTQDKSRIFVLSDITNEPDDSMSLVRLLSHADMYTIEGMAAVTSWWLNATTAPEAMEAIINKYETVRPNLQTHTDGEFPSASYLLPRVKSGAKTYGLEAIDALEAGGQISEGAQLLIDAVVASRERLYVQVWGGANTLAEALWYMRKTRAAHQLSEFISRLSVYTISDQDNTGQWIRAEFPNLRYIVSIHGWNQYNQGTWLGIATAMPTGGPDPSVVSEEWIAENIQIGPLGEEYPDVVYTMEGDTPTILFTMQNGLNVPEHPEYGGWGGRYVPVTMGGQLFANAADAVVGLDNKTYQSAQASIWRWREAYQHEFAARMQWTLRARGEAPSTTHPPLVMVNGTCGNVPYEVEAEPGASLTFDATGTWNQDTNSTDGLEYNWIQYKDVTFSPLNVVGVWNITVPVESGGKVVVVDLPPLEESCDKVRNADYRLCQVYHLVLEVKNTAAAIPMTRYTRIVIKVKQ